MFLSRPLRDADPVLSRLLTREAARQGRRLYLCAASSTMPRAVAQAWSSVVGNLDLEGRAAAWLESCSEAELLDLPARERECDSAGANRYNGGALVGDVLEELIRRRAIAVFSDGASRLCVNAQPATGAIALMAALRGLAAPGDCVLRLDSRLGGHAAHGQDGHWNASLYHCRGYGLTADETAIDYAGLQRQIAATRARVVIAGFSAFPRAIDWRRLRAAVDLAGKRCYLLADISHTAGLVAAGQFPNPTAYADATVFATYKTLLGPRGAMILSRTPEVGDAIGRALFPGLQSSPVSAQLPALAAVLQLAQTEEYRALQTRILANARELTLALGRHGVPVAYGGTDCQMAIVDGRAIGGSREFDARHFAWALQSAGLIANAVGLGGDKRGAARGLRLGLTWPAQRGMDETEMEPLAALLARLLAVYQASAGDIGGRRWRAAARQGRALARRWARK